MKKQVHPIIRQDMSTLSLTLTYTPTHTFSLYTHTPALSLPECVTVAD